MNTAVRFFTDYLTRKDIVYSVPDENRVSVSFKGDNYPIIRSVFIFGDDGRDVAIRVFTIAKVPKDKALQVLAVCSVLNAEYRWVKFYLDTDWEVTAAMDAVIDPYTTGEECYELLMQMTQIVDKSYPEIMEALWGK